FDNSWSVTAGSPAVNTCATNNSPCQVTINGNITLNAHFALNQSSGGGGGGGGGGGHRNPPGQVLGESTSIPFQPQVLAAELPRTGLPVTALYLLLGLLGLTALPALR